MRQRKVSHDCGSCMGFGIIYLPELIWETTKDGQKQARWVYRSVKCAACFVQLELSPKWWRERLKSREGASS